MKKELIDKINNIYWKYTTGPQVINKPQDLAVLTSICAFGYKVNRGPIGISKALFNNKTEVTLITLGGTQFKDGQATRLLESKLSMASKENDYLTGLLNAFKLKDEDGNLLIPKNRPIIISGISLGGMIAQQLISKDEIIDNYNILSIICFGSPFVKPFDRKNIRIKRFSEKGDIVPKLGCLKPIFLLKNKKIKKELDKNEVILENGKYKTRLESHALSYVENENWNKYDFYGEINGKNKLEILTEIKFIDVPILNK